MAFNIVVLVRVNGQQIISWDESYESPSYNFVTFIIVIAQRQCFPTLSDSLSWVSRMRQFFHQARRCRDLFVFVFVCARGAFPVVWVVLSFYCSFFLMSSSSSFGRKEREVGVGLEVLELV